MSLPELPGPDRTMWQHGKQIDHYTADQMRAYALQAVEALRPVAMTDKQAAECINKAKTSLFDRDGTTSFRIVRAVEAHHGITQKEQGK